MSLDEVVEAVGKAVDVAGIVIVLICTFLSIALQVETEARWPWQPRGGMRSPAAGI